MNRPKLNNTAMGDRTGWMRFFTAQRRTATTWRARRHRTAIGLAGHERVHEFAHEGGTESTRRSCQATLPSGEPRCPISRLAWWGPPGGLGYANVRVIGNCWTRRRSVTDRTGACAVDRDAAGIDHARAARRCRQSLWKIERRVEIDTMSEP